MSSNLQSSSNTFTDLNNVINGNEDDVIDLNSNYTYSSEDSDFQDGILINRSLTINGNGHTIDAKSSARIFYVGDGIETPLNGMPTVIFNDIVFVNGNSPDVPDTSEDEYETSMGGAISSYNLFTYSVINCTFINNTAEEGGALAGAMAINCTFTNNSASYAGGAAFYILAENCIFNNNTAVDYGGALYFAQVINSTFNANTVGDRGGAIFGAFGCVNSNFTNNSAGYDGGAIYGADEIVNSTFIQNHAKNGGALHTADSLNCIFMENYAEDYGGAVYCSEDNTVTDCILANNTADYGGAICGGIASYCSFDANTANIEGDDTYNTSLVNNPNVEISSSIYLDESMLRYYFPKNATGSISIYVDAAEEASYSSEIITGKWIRLYPNDLDLLSSGTYNLKVVYSGDENYENETWEESLEIVDYAFSIISFNATDGEGVMADVIVETDSVFTLPECNFTKEYRVFYGWNVGDAIKQPGENITVSDNIIIKTVWKYNGEIQSKTSDISYDGSTTSINGTLILTDTATGEVLVKNITSGPEKSSMTNATANDSANLTDVTINQLLTFAQTQAGSKELTVKNQTVSNFTATERFDNRTYTWIDSPYEGDDGLISYSMDIGGFMLIEGKYGTIWEGSVLIEAEYESDPANCVVSFNATDGEGVMADVSVEANTVFILPECNFTKEYRIFYAWNVNGSIMQPGDTLTVIDDISIITIWKYDAEINETGSSKTKILDLSVDSSTTTINGTLVLTDTRTGEVFTKNITVGPLNSSMHNSTSGEAEGIVENTIDQLLSIAQTQAGKKTVTEKDQEVANVTSTSRYDNRSYTWMDYYEGIDGIPSDIVKNISFLLIGGDYGTIWEGSVLIEAEYESDSSSNITDENETAPGNGTSPGSENVTNVGTAAELQELIDKAKPGSVLDLANKTYENVSNINITKNITLSGGVIVSDGSASPLFNILSNGSGPDYVSIANNVFYLKNGDVVVSANANSSSPSSIDVPEISIKNNSFQAASDDLVAESVTILKLESSLGILNPTKDISVLSNSLESGMKPFSFVVSEYASTDVYIPEGGNIAQKLATEIVCNNMTTNAININIDGRNGEYFTFKLVDSNGKALANKDIVVGFNGHVYSYTTDSKGSAQTQINLGVQGGYTFAVSFLGDEYYNASFAVAKITVNPEPVKLTTAKKTYKASAKTKTLTATLVSSRGSAIAGKKISFTVNGKTYTGTTNSKGVATVKVSISKKGTYSFTAKFAGDNRCKATSVKSSLKIS